MRQVLHRERAKNWPKIHQKFVNDLLPLPIKSKAQMAMNHTKRARKHLYSSGKNYN